MRRAWGDAEGSWEWGKNKKEKEAGVSVRRWRRRGSLRRGVGTGVVIEEGGGTDKG